MARAAATAAVLAYAALMGGTAGRAVAPLALWHVPTAWGYTLSEGCYWRARPWTAYLGPHIPTARPDRAGRRAEWRCLHDRGLKSTVIFHVHVLSRWPDPATIARWETEDASRDPPPADWAIPDPALPH